MSLPLTFSFSPPFQSDVTQLLTHPSLFPFGHFPPRRKLSKQIFFFFFLASSLSQSLLKVFLCSLLSLKETTTPGEEDSLTRFQGSKTPLLPIARYSGTTLRPPPGSESLPSHTPQPQNETPSTRTYIRICVEVKMKNSV